MRDRLEWRCHVIDLVSRAPGCLLQYASADNLHLLFTSYGAIDSMSREVQLAANGRPTDPFAYCRMPSTTPRRMDRTSGLEHSNAQSDGSRETQSLLQASSAVNAWTTGSDEGRQTRSHARGASGKRLAVIEQATDDTVGRTGRRCFSFSCSTELLVTHDHGVLR